MDKIRVISVDIKYRRPGLTYLYFTVERPEGQETGVVKFDTVSSKFITYTKDVNLLAVICTYLQNPLHRSVG